MTSHGYPFYPGAIEYTANFNVSEQMLDADKIIFKIGEFNGCSSTVFVNGKLQGYIDKEPYSLCLDKCDLVAGQNEIKVRLLGSFRNMFGPSHLVDFDPSGCSRWTWHFDFEHTDVTEYDTENLTNSFQLVPYGISKLGVELYYCKI